MSSAARKPNNKPEIRLRIIHKGLAFILVPVVIQCLCIFELYRVIQKAEYLADNEALQTKIVELQDEVALEIATGFAHIFNHQMNGAPQDEPDAALKRVSALIDQERPLAEQAHIDTRYLTQSQEFARRQMHLIKRLEPTKGKAQSDLEKIRTAMTIKYLFMDMSVKALDLRKQISESRERLNKTRAEEKAAREQVKTTVFLGLLVEILLTFVLLTVFIRNITQRLKILVGNAQLLPSSSPLSQTVPGSDELAYLDKALHRASSDLRRAAEHRRSLTQMVAHDLRSPLMSAELIVEILQKLCQTSTEQIQSKIRVLKQTMSQLISLVEDLLTIDKLEAGKLELNCTLVDVKDFVSTSAETVIGLAGAKHVFLDNEVEAIKVIGDRNRLLQVMTNLLSNAIKYSPEYGHVEITSEVSGELVKIGVRDSGRGISPAAQKRIFDKFFQAEASDANSGFGLGLAVCKLIVSEHEGEIGVQSEEGKGSTFWFTLPIDTGED